VGNLLGAGKMEEARRTDTRLIVFSVLASLGVAMGMAVASPLFPMIYNTTDEVRSLARLETIQYNMEKVITAEQNQGIFGALIGDKLLFVAHGYVIAGVDLSELKADDLWLTGETLHVRLPHAQVFVATLDNEKSYIYDRSLGILTKGNPTLESAARLAAEQEIRKAAEDDGILDQAQTNAEAYISSLLTQLGYPRIVFEDPTAP
jgi:hypothetical protein